MEKSCVSHNSFPMNNREEKRREGEPQTKEEEKKRVGKLVV